MTRQTKTDNDRAIGRRRRGAVAKRLRWAISRVAAGLVLVMLIPVLLVPVYRSGTIHPVSTLMLADLVTFQGYRREWVSIGDVAPVALYSVLMSEDGKFCEHNGVDWGELNQVIDDALDGEKTRGASTIVMQTGKNLFLWHGRSYLRKAIEVPLAIYVDLVIPKKRIMEIYVNIAEWGPGIYGIEAAAGHYFNRSAAKLTPRQAALLAVTLPAPTSRNPAKPSSALSRLARVIERRASKAGGYVGCLQ